MMNTKTILALISILACLFACSGNKTQQYSDNDSIALLESQKEEIQKESDAAMAEIAASLDSIAIQEHMLLSTSTDAQGNKLSKQQILQNIHNFKSMLDNQRQKLSTLQKNLEDSKLKNKNLLQIIDFLNTQLEEKDAQIAELASEVQSGKREITSLKGSVATLTQTNKLLNEDRTELRQTNQRQHEIMNTGYVIIGTSKKLKSLGILTGGFLKKTKVDAAGIDKSKFQTVNMQTTKEINVNGKSPKIKSQLPPARSYHWSGNTLYIDSPADFWRATPYLVIVVK